MIDVSWHMQQNIEDSIKNYSKLQPVFRIIKDKLMIRQLDMFKNLIFGQSFFFQICRSAITGMIVCDVIIGKVVTRELDKQIWLFMIILLMSKSTLTDLIQNSCINMKFVW